VRGTLLYYSTVTALLLYYSTLLLYYSTLLLYCNCSTTLLLYCIPTSSSNLQTQHPRAAEGKESYDGGWPSNPQSPASSKQLAGPRKPRPQACHATPCSPMYCTCVACLVHGLRTSSSGDESPSRPISSDACCDRSLGSCTTLARRYVGM